MKSMLRVVALGLVAFTSLQAKSQDAIHIYVFAEWDSPQRAWTPVYCDGSLVARVKAGKFFAIDVPPGQHTLLLADGVPLPLDVSPGTDTFLAVQRHVRIYPSRSSTPILAIFPESEARLKLVHLAYLGTRRIYSPLVSREDPTLLWRPELKRRNAN